ncbi:MAG: PhnD/SsuA/transferrin family substrate-binding protein [Polyangiaceae bacterium]|nr:PhnD/SsuA/transferrin family substrate-binding protein [Polyangiaceae bacterium]
MARDPGDELVDPAGHAPTEALVRGPRTAGAPGGLRFAAVLGPDAETSHPIFAGLCEALGRALSVPVTGAAYASYDELLEVVALGRFELVWLPPLLALRAARGAAAEAVVLPVRNGAVSYSTALFVRPDSPIRGVDDLGGSRIAWVDRLSVGGHLVARALLRARGLDPQRVFAEERFLGSHGAVARAVERGRADVGASFAYFARPEGGARQVRHAGWGTLPVRVLVDVGGIPMDLLAVRPGLAPELRRGVSDALLAPGDGDVARLARALLSAESFEPAPPGLFDELAGVLAHVDFDPTDE